MGNAPSTASVLESCQRSACNVGLAYVLMVGVETILVPILLLERELCQWHGVCQ